MTAIAQKTAAGKNPLEPICVLVEGSTYHKSKTLSAKINRYVDIYTNKHYRHYIDIFGIENAALVGAAIAGLSP